VHFIAEGIRCVFEVILGLACILQSDNYCAIAVIEVSVWEKGWLFAGMVLDDMNSLCFSCMVLVMMTGRLRAAPVRASARARARVSSGLLVTATQVDGP